ncbi:MAG: DNA cytosine methyltransferase [Pyrinomonadaceae bacterium]
MSKKLSFVDLFCGAGGLSAGFEKAGFHSVFANDSDSAACETYRFNHPNAAVFHGDVAELSAGDILEQTGLASIPLVIGGPNCQGVSLRGKRDPNDPKNHMFGHFRRLIGELKPDWFVMENVPGLMHRHNLGLVTSIFSSLEELGYRCGGQVLLAADYGVPQLRYRFILIGNKHGEPIVFPNPTHHSPMGIDEENCELFQDEFEPNERLQFWRGVRDAISDLPVISNGGGQEVVPYPETPSTDQLSDFQKLCRNGDLNLYNHICHRTSDKNIEYISYVPPGKNWKSIPEEIRPERFKRVALKDHTTTYGRLRWDMPARTVTTYFNNISAGAFTHPSQNRGISVREGARLQGFADAFRFRGTVSRQYRQVGNAVPPLLASHIAGVLHQQMAGGSFKESNSHEAAVEYERTLGTLRIHRPLQGMRFNLDKYLVRS